MRKKIAIAVSTAALFLGAVTPTFAATTIQISGNGAGSSNTITVNKTSSASVNQSNLASISNNLSSNANTGSNNANSNTGGNVSVNSGNSSSTTRIRNHANVNFANVKCCYGSTCP